MPVEPRAGDASAYFAAPPRAVVLHRQRMSGADAGATPAGVFGQQLPHDVPDDGARARHVRHAPAPQPDPRLRQTQNQPAGSRRRTANTSKNLITIIKMKTSKSSSRGDINVFQ